MRLLSIIALVAALSGCAREDRPLAPRDLARWPSKSCAGLALQRTEDAKLNGYDAGLQRVIFDATYADCVRWDEAHRIN